MSRIVDYATKFFASYGLGMGIGTVYMRLKGYSQVWKRTGDYDYIRRKPHDSQ